MTRDELYSILKKNRGWETDTETVLKLIWGQAFDGETEKITERDTKRDTERDTESSVAATSGNEADFVTKTMTTDEIKAAKMARDLHQIREQILYLGKN